jgi:hypothetical protein
MAVRLTVEAQDHKSGLTLAELVEFVDRAQASGCAGTDAAKATANLQGRVKTLTLVQPDEPSR